MSFVFAVKRKKAILSDSEDEDEDEEKAEKPGNADLTAGAGSLFGFSAESKS